MKNNKNILIYQAIIFIIAVLITSLILSSVHDFVEHSSLVIFVFLLFSLIIVIIKLLAEYRKNTTLLKTILDSLGIAIYGVDLKGNTTFINKSATDILGYSKEEMLGKNQHYIIHHSHKDGKNYPITDCNVYKAMLTGEIMQKDDEVFWHKNGKPINIEYIAAPIKNSSGCITGGVVGFFDITERIKQAKELKRHRDKLKNLVDEQVHSLKIEKEFAEKSNKVKGEFLSNMSHELRTPMHAIINYAKLGQSKIDKLPDNEKLKLEKYLSNILKSGNRLLKLLNDLLDLSKVEAGEMTMFFEKSNLEEITKNALTELESLIHNKNINIERVNNTSSLDATFDKGRIIQVVINLLSNAIKFSPNDSTITIIFDEETTKMSGNDIPSISLSIKDEGAGVPNGELETIFDQFIQSSDTKTGAGGTGLGLSICKEIIQEHNGKIWAENSNNSGAIFKFIIPKEQTQEKK